MMIYKPPSTICFANISALEPVAQLLFTYHKSNIVYNIVSLQNDIENQILYTNLT